MPEPPVPVPAAAAPLTAGVSAGLATQAGLSYVVISFTTALVALFTDRSTEAIGAFASATLVLGLVIYGRMTQAKAKDEGLAMIVAAQVAPPVTNIITAPSTPLEGVVERMAGPPDADDGAAHEATDGDPAERVVVDEEVHAT